MTALEQVSERYEQAKRDYANTLSDREHLMTDLLIKQTEMYTWGRALQILQSCRGNFVG